MSKNWTDYELLSYCETHCRTERALFHSDHIKRVALLAGNEFLGNGWFSMHEDMQTLVDTARARIAQKVGP